MLAIGARFASKDLPKDVIARRSLLEAWLLHLRGLIEFFYPNSGTKPDTLTAAWYVADTVSWAKRLPKLRKREARRRVAIHKHLAHISYLRDGRVAKWRSQDQDIVMKRLRLFRDNLHKRRLSWFPSLAKL